MHPCLRYTTYDILHTMLIYIRADHQGFKLKESLKKYLQEEGYEVIDVGNDHYKEDDDYPDFASLVGRAVGQDPVGRRGIVVCRSGIGVDIVANKYKGVRSALVHNSFQAKLSRTDDDANVLALSDEFASGEKAEKIVETWLKTPFSGDERHIRRLEKIREIENSL